MNTSPMPTSAKNAADFDDFTVITSTTGLKAQLPTKFAKRNQKEIDALVLEAHGTGVIHAAVRAAMAMTAI